MNKGSDCKAYSTLGILALFFQSDFFTELILTYNLIYLFIYKIFFILCVWKFLSACVPVYHVHAVPIENKRGQQTPLGTGVIDPCHLSCGLWESNPRPLEEQSMLLTTVPSSFFIKYSAIHSVQMSHSHTLRLFTLTLHVLLSSCNFCSHSACWSLSHGLLYLSCVVQSFLYKHTIKLLPLPRSIDEAF